MPLFATAGSACADQPDPFSSLGVGDDQQVSRIGPPDQDHSCLMLRVVWVGNGDRERIREDAAGLVEGDAVLLAVGLGLLRIPLKVDPHAPTIYL